MSQPERPKAASVIHFKKCAVFFNMGLNIYNTNISHTIKNATNIVVLLKMHNIIIQKCKKMVAFSKVLNSRSVYVQALQPTMMSKIFKTTYNRQNWSKNG